tara:strand:- start:1878 stop:2522 length:645 start_codon:yes stop_codon:yes gene_type:complete
MEKEIDYKNLDQEGLKFLATSGRPIAGSSLTNPKESAYAWEQPPEFTNLQEATEALFVEITEPETMNALLDLIENKLSIGQISEIILTDGFQKGMFNPDLMLLLIEPTMYMLIYIAEKAGITDYVTYVEENEESEEDVDMQESEIDNIIQQAKENLVPIENKGKLKTILSEEVVSRLEELEVPSRSLLEKTDEEEILEVEEEQPMTSLLSREAQ